MNKSKGEPDEHWAMRTGGIITESPVMEKVIFMKSKPKWIPPILKPEQEFHAMPQ